MTTTAFRDAYKVLNKHAETLRNQREPDIDNLLSIVTESVDAYKVCKERIDAVEKALAQALNNAGVSKAEASPASSDDEWLGELNNASPPEVGAGTGTDLDDIPF